jgi:hypothetical protein
MVHSRKAELEVKIEVDISVDIIDDKDRLKAVEKGLGCARSISKGLYEQGVSFKVDKVNFKIK